MQRPFAAKLTSIGLVTVAQVDLALMTSSIAMAESGDALVVICEHGKQSALGAVCRQFRERRCKVISITRNTTNSLRVHADVSLLISAHDERPHVAMLMYQSALQHVLDLTYALLVEDSDVRLKRLLESLQRLRQFQEG